MKDTAGVKTFDLKWFGTLTLKQMFGIISALAFALVLTLYGFGASCTCFGMMIIAVVLYMLPKMLKVENFKLMTLVGVLFAVTAILVGGLVTAPALVGAYEGNPPDNDYFVNVEYEYESGNMKISATLANWEGIDDDDKLPVVHFSYGKVLGIGFGMIPENAAAVEKFDPVPMNVNKTDGSVSGSVKIDNNNLYFGYLTVKKTDESGKNVLDGSSVTRFLKADPFEGSITSLGLFGCLISTLYIMIMFFMIMIFSNIMRNRMEKTRERMEQEGRLYPQGYGKCEECGAIVLPGEVNCRKCGAYIDRPDEMKPNKKDFFECSDCGAEVPSDAKTCPKCGVAFEEDETEVTHADGRVESTKETFACPECGYVVPGTATFCNRCGAKFKKK
jgi:ribosomal protein L40E